MSSEEECNISKPALAKMDVSKQIVDCFTVTF